MIQRAEQDRDLADFGVRFDVMSSEQAIYDSGRVERALDPLAERGLTFESEGALWLRTTDFGDDKDRVLRKSDGSFTYLVPDIAYHIDKHDRGFDRVIDVWGADHHGYIPRMRAVLAALGYPPEFFDVALVQLVKVVRGGEEVKMSKRSGEFVTLRDLYEEVGVDAARYFFLMRKGASPLDFDVDLAKRQTDENPVFYVQMAHARLSGIFRTAERSPDSVTGPLDLAALPAPQDAELLKKLVTFPEIVEKAAREREPHRVTVYLHELATVVHALVSPHAGRRRPRRTRHRAGSPAARAGGAHRAGQRPRPARHLRPRPDVNLMSLLVVGSIALDSIYTPFGETADALGGSAVYFSVAGLAAAPGAGRGRGRAATTRWPSSSAWRRAESTGAAWSAPRARASAGRGSIPTTCRAGRRSTPGWACSPTSSPSSPRRSAPPSSCSSATSTPSSSSACWSQVAAARRWSCATR